MPTLWPRDSSKGDMKHMSRAAVLVAIVLMAPSVVYGWDCGRFAARRAVAEARREIFRAQMEERRAIRRAYGDAVREARASVRQATREARRQLREMRRQLRW